MDQSDRSRFYGEFCLEFTGDGILCGPYTNNRSNCVFDERAVRKAEDDKSPEPTSPGDSYGGEYETVWWEHGQPSEAKLTITQNPVNPRQYRLEWKIDGKLKFVGDAFAHRGMLIGGYTSTQ